jgi:hypothetical protein
MNCASSVAEPTSNSDLVLILRSTLIKARSLFLVDFCWVKGHAEIGGNTRVDQLSKFFASAVSFCLGSNYVARARNYFTCSRVWRYGFPLSNIPYYFRVPDSTLHLEHWYVLVPKMT